MKEETRNYYIEEQLGHAVSYLVTGHGRIKERLGEVAASTLGVLRADQFPTPLQHDAERIFDRLDTNEPEGDEGSYAASIRAMTDYEASDLAADILALQHRLELYWAERARAVRS